MRYGLVGLALPLVLGLAQAEEAVVYNWHQDGSLGGPATECRVFTSGRYNASASTETREVTFRSHASVAQWADLSVDNNQVHCVVRRPGRYAIDCFTITVRSNGDLGILEEGYDGLHAVGQSVDQTVDLYVQKTPCGELPKLGRWQTAHDLALEDRLTDESKVRKGVSWTVWLGLEVPDSASPGQYQTVGRNTVTLLDHKDWLDDNGDWRLD